jgi:hypothetical protein
MVVVVVMLMMMTTISHLEKEWDYKQHVLNNWLKLFVLFLHM